MRKFSAIRSVLPVRAALAGVALLLIVSPMAGRAAQSSGPKRAFETKDWYKVKTVGSPSMSPDGRFVAVQVTSVIEAKNARINEIWVVGTAPGSESIRASAPGLDSTNPSFSADSTTVIYSSTRPGYSNTRWASRVDRPSGEFAYTGAAAESAPVETPPADFGGRGGGAGNVNSSQPKDKSFTVSTGVEGGPSPAAAAGAGGGRNGGGGGRNGGGARGGSPVPDAPAAPGAPAENAAAGNGAGRGRTPDAGDPFASMLPMAKPPTNAITLPLDPARFDGMQITDERYKANGRGFLPSNGTGAGGNRAGGAGRGGGRGAADNANAVPTQILIDHLDGAGRKAITQTQYSHRNAIVSPDGKWIVFAADADLRPDTQVATVRADIAKLGTDAERTTATRDKLQSDLFVIPVAGGTPKRIKTPGSESGIEWSPDSKYFTFTANNGPNTTGNIYLADVAGGSSKSLTSDLRTDLGPVTWLASNDALLSLTVGGRNALYRLNPRTGERKELVGGRRRISNFVYDRERSKVAYIATSIDTPTEFFLSDLNGAAPERQLTHFNAELNNTIAWSPGDRFTFKSVRDVEVEGWLMKPFGYEPGKKYPLVLYIHGGPHSAYNEGWFDEFQNLTGAGMFVLYTNPRGSSGYGAEFQDMIRNRWGDEDYMDLMKAVDICIARPQADVDATRLGVTGGSYGGFMTTWITTKTDRFKAAEADRMIVNWVSWYGTSDAQSLTEGEFLGNPWENWDSYINMSPIKYANKVKTPTLLVQSEEDFRAPIEDAEQWFMALKKNNVPAEFVRYPRSNHDLSRTGEPWLLTDRLYRIRTWFSYWLKDEKPTRPTLR